MKHKYALYPIIMSICALCCFLGVLLVFASAVQPPWGRVAFLIFPALVLGLFGFLAAKGKLRLSATIAWTTALSVLLFFASVFYVSVLCVWTATTTTTDIHFYSRAYGQIAEEDSVQEVFPQSIPADAKDITFTYCPQFLQGGEEFILSYTTTDEILSNWTTRLKREAEWIGPNQQWYSENNWSFDGVYGTRYQLDWDGGSNHGEICYVLIDEENRQITFYYSHW
ncbi:MAG: hypothetical protein IKK11_02910 [Oscillospiraceae bacterium]|nr:hypothetical protein [Oscillospiraceae bacterium]